MQTIKIKVGNGWYGFQEVEVVSSELRRVISEHPELVNKNGGGYCSVIEKKSFGERMIGKWYWFIDSVGYKGSTLWNNNGHDNQRLSVNNIHWTEESCDKEIARKLALGNIMSYIRDNEIELVKDEDYGNEDITKYCIGGWDYSADEVYVDSWGFNDVSVFNQNFYSQEDREKVISNCAKDLTTLLKK